MAHSPLVMFLNPDARIDLPSIDLLHDDLAMDPQTAATGPSFACHNSPFEANAGGADKSLINALIFALCPARSLPERHIWRSVFPRSADSVQVDWVSGASMLIRRGALLEVGGFPEDYFLYDEDVELGLLLRRSGYDLHIVPQSRATHRVGGSQSGVSHHRQWALSNQRYIYRNTRRRWALITLLLVQAGLWRRAFRRQFLGRDRPYLYAFWSSWFLVRYRARLPVRLASLLDSPDLESK